MRTEELEIRYRKYRNTLKVLMFVLIISAGFGIFYWQVTAAKAEVVETWGMADAKEININSKVSGRVMKLFVDEGDRVTQGQLIAKIDSDTQEPQQRAAQANLAAQYSQLQQIIISSKNLEETLNASLRAAQAQEAQAQTALNLAAKDEARYRELLTAEAIPAQTYDAYRSKLEDAQAVLTAAQAEVASAKANLLKNDENKALEQAARDQAAALQGQLDAVNVMLGETEIFAPFAGVVTKKFAEEGMLISPTVPLYSLQDTADNWIDFKIKETELKSFSLGDKITLEGRDGSTQITGAVESIRRKADFATQKATSERGDPDVIAFNVKIRTNNPNIWPGMRFRILR